MTTQLIQVEQLDPDGAIKLVGAILCGIPSLPGAADNVGVSQYADADIPVHHLLQPRPSSTLAPSRQPRRTYSGTLVRIGQRPAGPLAGRPSLLGRELDVTDIFDAGDVGGDEFTAVPSLSPSASGHQHAHGRHDCQSNPLASEHVFD